MELIIITDFDLDNPSGAGYNRVVCYAKSLASENVVVRVYSTKYIYKSDLISDKAGKNLHLIKSKWVRKYKTTFEDFHLLRFFKFCKSVHKFSLRDNQSTEKTYLLYNSNLASVLICLLYLKVKMKCRVYIEKNELKTAIILNMPLKSNNLIKSFGMWLIKTFLIVPALITDFLPICFDGIIAISTRFEKLYSRFNKNIIRLPILVDTAKALQKRNVVKSTGYPFLIGYFGVISEKKDGLFSLVKAVHSLSGKDVKLRIFGRGNKFFDALLDKISFEHPNIEYNGQIASSVVPAKLIQCDLLAFPRPKNLQTTYGFSTKLGEFLASKVPVLTSGVSDNPIYLKDNKNAFLLEPEKKVSIHKLKKKLELIVNLDPAQLKAIGDNGFNTASNHFNPMKYSTELKLFLFPSTKY